MIKHIVMWKLKENAEGKTKLENAKIMKERLEALKAEIKEIKVLELGINVVESPASYDAVLYSEFASKADLEVYAKHPSHLKVGEFINKVREDRVVVDYLV
ncbi:MAG: stress responsive barrel domain protein [Haloplasmataceae bacterium]|jgi:hypothetical protein|nr:stress responsive barrel domain protein [Haloplasmataceae bacterium]